MRVIINAELDQLQLAVRAVKLAIERNTPDTVIAFENGDTFHVKQITSGWTVTGWNTKPKGKEP